MSLLKFSENCDFLNGIANHPDIFPKIALKGQSTIDLSPIWRDCIGMECAEGGFVFHFIGDGMYEVHTLMHSGSHVLSCAKEAMWRIFCATDCTELVSRVPAANRAANLLARKAGLKHRYKIPWGWNGLHSRSDCDHFGITLWDWIIGNDYLKKIGDSFHERLEAVIGELSHPHDEAHNAFVGFVNSCLLFKNTAKGVFQYNKWAIVSGYEPINFDGENILFNHVKIDAHASIKVG